MLSDDLVVLRPHVCEDVLVGYSAEGGEGGVRTYRPLSALSLSPLNGGLQRGEIIDVEGVRVHLE